MPSILNFYKKAVCLTTFLSVLCLLDSSCQTSTMGKDLDGQDGIKEEYLKTVADAKALMTDDAVCIVFATDLHYSYPHSGYYDEVLVKPIDKTFQLISDLSNELNPGITCLGGDYIQLPFVEEGQTKEMGFKNLDHVNAFMNSLKGNKFLLSGNHEANYTGNGTGYGMTVEEFYSYTQKKWVDEHQVVEVGDSHQVFYRDDDKAKIRYLFLSTMGLNYQPLLRDIKASLSNIHPDFQVIVFNHFAGYDNSKPEVYPQVRQVIKTIKETGCELIAWIGGHNHADMSYSCEGTAVISCLQSGAWTPGLSQDGRKYEHKKDTKDEVAISVLVIRKDLGKIYVKRLGLGRDREINCRGEGGGPGFVKWDN